ncbi:MULTISPECIES: hypothetical protein [Bacillus cereus group]|nr:MULTISPECIES: hypothetical protein [Bacillus cereus group]EJR25253.1 hypothetical protein IIE_06290 [Bacillus cereus VD045]MDO6632587.1 hypothetical protein [Bacillus thuringiensis]MDO6663372.1 hypothetical protein [Bacillus thuringiensis]MDO6702730.1 hypothetical protein [Bacillus thuringiensis]
MKRTMHSIDDPLAFAKGCKYALTLVFLFWQVIGAMCYGAIKLVL